MGDNKTAPRRSSLAWLLVLAAATFVMAVWFMPVGDPPAARDDSGTCATMDEHQLRDSAAEVSEEKATALGDEPDDPGTSEMIDEYVVWDSQDFPEEETLGIDPLSEEYSFTLDELSEFLDEEDAKALGPGPSGAGSGDTPQADPEEKP